MRVGLITTLETNIGDDFIREGLCRVMRSVFGDEEIEFVPINKHTPDMVYSPRHPVARMRSLPVQGYRRKVLLRRMSRVFKYIGFTKFHHCDAIVQCGAPVYWLNCGKTTGWRQDLWEDVIEPLHHRIPVLNLAAGSCFAYRHQPERFELPADRKYVRWLHGMCRATSVRDPLAQKLLAAEQCEAELIRCSAFLFTNPSQVERRNDGPILINYMQGGGHFDLGQPIDADRWQHTVVTLIHRFKAKGERVVLLCHDQKELDLARALAPDCEQLLPKSFSDFPRLVRNAKAAICNRMHASVALAGLGIPSVAVGTDTRMLMVQQLELPCYFVNDAHPVQIERDIDRLISERSQIAERLASLQQLTHQTYARLIERVLLRNKVSRPLAVSTGASLGGVMS
jgi:polysaccharide pyruvyl transferase WcaK-like protein